MNTIDLSKIAVKELPTTRIKANFDGTEKEFTVTAFSDGDRTTFAALSTDKEDVFRLKNLYIFLLSSGLGIEQDVAAYLYANVNDEAVRVGGEIFNFNRSCDEARAREVKEAEKNLVDAAVPPELPPVATAL